MSPRILVIAMFSASLAALPMLASAQTGSTTTPPMPQTTTGTGMGTGSMGSGSMGTGSMSSGGSMNDSSFNARNYRTGADCLNAATAAHVALSACDSLKNR